MSGGGRMDSLRLVLVGAGAIAEHHLQAFSAHGHWQIVGVVDPDRGAADRLLARSGVRAWTETELAHAVRSRGFDAAVVSSPTEHHFAQSLLLLRAGRHVLVEKPVATSPNELQALADAAGDRRLVAMGAHVVSFLPTTVLLSELVHRGVLGAIRHISFERMEFRPQIRPWMAGSHDFLLWHWGTHALDGIASAYDVQRTTRLFYAPSCSARDRPVVDNIVLAATTEDQVALSVGLSWSSRVARHAVRIVGDDATIRIDGYSALANGRDVLLATTEGDALQQGFASQAGAFYDAITRGTSASTAVSRLIPRYGFLYDAVASVR